MEVSVMSGILLFNVSVATIPAPKNPARESSALQPAEAEVFPFLPPTHLPSGLALSKSTVIEVPRQFVVLAYSNSEGSDGSILVIYTQIAGLDEDDNGYRRYFVVGDIVKDIEVAGQPAALIQRVDAGDLSIVRENGSLLNHVLGNGFREDELAAVAESIPQVS
jgi:hypothetical protein